MLAVLDEGGLYDKLAKLKEIQNVVVCGKSGAGKTTLVDRMIGLFNGHELPLTEYLSDRHPLNYPNLSVSKSVKYTTRPPRPDDDPEEIKSVSPDEFTKLVEGARISNHYSSEGSGDYSYGFSDITGEGVGVRFIIANSPQVAKDLRWLYGCPIVFVDTEDADLAKRIRSRGGDESVIENRIKRLKDTPHMTAYDRNSKEYPIGLRENFYGTGNEEGIADIIVINEGSIEYNAQNLFEEIVREIGDRSDPKYMPRQKILKFSLDSQGVPSKEILPGNNSFEEVVKEIGPSYYRNRDGYDALVTLGVAVAGGKRKYFIQFSDMNKPDDLHLARPLFFRGCQVYPVEYWGIKSESSSGVYKNVLHENLVSNHFRELPISNSAVERGLDTENVYSGFRSKNSSSYAEIEHIFLDSGLDRLI